MILNTVLHGDCIEKIEELPDESVDLIIADPPYQTSNIKKIVNSCLRKLNIGGKFILETDSNHSFNSNAKQINFGSTKIHIWNN